MCPAVCSFAAMPAARRAGSGLATRATVQRRRAEGQSEARGQQEIATSATHAEKVREDGDKEWH